MRRTIGTGPGRIGPQSRQTAGRMIAGRRRRAPGKGVGDAHGCPEAARSRGVHAGRLARNRRGRPDDRSGSLSDVSEAPARSPLLSLAAIHDDRDRIEGIILESVQTADPYLTEIASHLVVAGGKRLRPVVAIVAAQVHGAPAQPRRGAGRGRLRVGTPRFALSRRRDRRGRHPAQRRDRQRQVGQPPGDPGWGLPARSGLGDRGVAGRRGGWAAGPHHRPTV